MRIGISFPSATRFATVLTDVAAYEEAGLDVVWVGESYGFDAVSAMGALAVVTQRVHIGSSVLGIFSRTPATLAMSAAGVDALSGGRALLGLGASGPQVVEGWHGVPYDAPLRRTREVVDICRAVWRRERLEHSGERYRIPLAADAGTGLGKPLKLIDPPVRERIPIYLAALGDRSVAQAAEIADGWVPAFLWPEKLSSIWGAALHDGSARRDPALGPLEIVASAPLAIGPDVDHLVDLVRPHIAHYIGGMGARDRNFYNDLAARYGFPAAAKEIQDLYLDGRKSEAQQAVPRDLLTHISLIGSDDTVRARLDAYQRAGVTVLNVDPIGDTTAGRAAQIRRLRALVDTLGG